MHSASFLSNWTKTENKIIPNFYFNFLYTVASSLKINRERAPERESSRERELQRESSRELQRESSRELQRERAPERERESSRERERERERIIAYFLALENGNYTPNYENDLGGLISTYPPSQRFP